MLHLNTSQKLHSSSEQLCFMTECVCSTESNAAIVRRIWSGTLFQLTKWGSCNTGEGTKHWSYFLFLLLFLSFATSLLFICLFVNWFLHSSIVSLFVNLDYEVDKSPSIRRSYEDICCTTPQISSIGNSSPTFKQIT